MHKNQYILSIICAIILHGCGTVPKLSGTYSSVTEDNNLYFAYEKYTFDNDTFTYNYYSDDIGSERYGYGNYLQNRYTAYLKYSEAPELNPSIAKVTTSNPNQFTFSMDFSVKIDDMSAPGVNIRIMDSTGVIKQNLQTNTEGIATFIADKEFFFPLNVNVRYIGQNEYKYTVNSPKNYHFDIDLKPSIGNLITAVTEEKDIRKKGDHIYINGKKFKEVKPITK